MACIITTNQNGDFQAPSGQKFTIVLTTPPGGLAFLHIIYAGGDPVKAAPYVFEVKAGVQNLHAFYAPDDANAQGQTFVLVEVCGATNQRLAINICDLSDPHFATQIEGV